MPDTCLQTVSTAKTLECRSCGTTFAYLEMLSSCTCCRGPLQYTVAGAPRPSRPLAAEVAGLWRYFDFLPLGSRNNIVSLGEGGSAIIEVPEASAALGGARLFVKMDAVQNPTGTFKDREASLVISRCKELGLDNLVFYSTGNTGRAYMHYASAAGLTTFLFVPAACGYKLTTATSKGPRNALVAVDDDYQAIAPYAKLFASQNNLTLIAPIHERTEAYATMAYEQVDQMPDCDFFAQTIASGMGPVGFVRGHRYLERLGLRPPSATPRVLCIQASETNALTLGYNAKKPALESRDVVVSPSATLYEPTLNSTNPVNNYQDLRESLESTSGAITDVTPSFVRSESPLLVQALSRRGFEMQFNLEKSLLIGYAGLVRFASEAMFSKGDRVLLLATGRGGEKRSELMRPDAVVRPSNDDPKDVARALAGRMDASARRA